MSLTSIVQLSLLIFYKEIELKEVGLRGRFELGEGGGPFQCRRLLTAFNDTTLHVVPALTAPLFFSPQLFTNPCGPAGCQVPMPFLSYDNNMKRCNSYAVTSQLPKGSLENQEPNPEFFLVRIHFSNWDPAACRVVCVYID